MAVTFRNFLGLKQGDDDTILRRLGRAGFNWCSLFVIFCLNDIGGLRAFGADNTYRQSLEKDKNEEDAQEAKRYSHPYKWNPSWRTLGL